MVAHLNYTDTSANNVNTLKTD